MKKNEQEVVQQRFTEAVLCNNNNRDLWSEVRRINGNGLALASTIDGQSSPG